MNNKALVVIDEPESCGKCPFYGKTEHGSWPYFLIAKKIIMTTCDLSKHRSGKCPLTIIEDGSADECWPNGLADKWQRSLYCKW